MKKFVERITSSASCDAKKFCLVDRAYGFLIDLKTTRNNKPIYTIVSAEL